MKVCFVVAAPATFEVFIRPLVDRMGDEVEVTVVSNHALGELHPADNVEMIDLPILRSPSLWRDVAAIVGLVKIFRQHRFDVVHSLTPKAGLLSAIAGYCARIPIRVHTFTGQVWSTKLGIRRFLLKLLDRGTAQLVTDALADSESQAAFLATEGFTKPIQVLGSGSIAGVDSTRFAPSSALRRQLRADLDIDESDLVFVFVGRLTRDKGVLDLVAAWRLAGMGPGCRLLIVGPDEEGLVPLISRDESSHDGSIILAGHTQEPEAFLAASDVFCLPSYREGFGTSVIEAAAVGLPAIVSNIYGLSDAVVSGETALVHPPGDLESLCKCLTEMAGDRAAREAMGSAARIRALEEFAVEHVLSELLAYYESCMRRP